MIQIGETEYRVYKNRLISMEEAEALHNRLQAEFSKGYSGGFTP